MRKILICLVIIMALMIVGGRANAVVFGDGGVGLQTVLNNITLSPNPGASSTNVLTDALTDEMDSYWSIHGSGGSVNTLIMEVAAWAGTNTFGIFDAFNPTKRVQIFDGAASTASQALLSILSDGSVVVNFVDSGIDFAGNTFGYYLDSTVGHPGLTGGVWYSYTPLNADQQDHLTVYQGKDIDTVQMYPLAPGIWDNHEYILAFEDLHSMHWSAGDPDYTDFVLMVQSIGPVPEPATLLLLGLGLIGVLGVNRKKFMG